MTLIDTSAWIHSLRPDGKAEVTAVVRALLENGDAAWCPIVRLELWNGARGVHEKRVLRELDSNLVELDLVPAVWGRAYDLARRARKRGKTVPATDIVVMACARHHGVDIAHDDEHLAELARL